MAAKKKQELARGAALVEQVIARIESGKCELEIVTPRPIPKEKLAKLTFPDGKPLPPSLARFLAYDGSWIMRTLGWFDDLEEPTLRPTTVSRLVKRHLNSEFHRAFKKLPRPLPRAEALPLDVGSETMRLLFLGAPDDAGEYPVLNVDVDDMPVVTFESPGFDTWLAVQAGLIDLEKAPWSAVLKESRARVFGKKTELECTSFDEAEEEEEEQPEVARAPKPVSSKPVAIKEGLAEDKLGKGLVEALEVGDAALANAFFDAAKQRFPKAREWGPIVLRHVVYGSDADFARRLFAAGVSPDAKGPYGAHFETAASYASVEVVRAFLDAGATIDLRTGSSKDTALIAACEKKRLDVARLLLDRGADPNLADNNDMAPLHHASHVFDPAPGAGLPESVEVCRLLLDRGAEIDLQDGNGRTALHWAVEENNEGVFELLLERRANPDLKQWAGDTALTLAHRHNRKAMFDKLRAAGARSDIKNKEGWCVDDLATDGAVGPKELDVRLSCTPGKHRAKLEMLVAFKGPGQGAELPIVVLANVAEFGGVGSDVHAPWLGAVTMKGGGLANNKGRATWDVTYEGVAPAVIAAWLRNLLGPDGPFHVRKLSLIGDGEPSIDSERVRRWLTNDAIDPIAPWPDPGFPVTDKGKGPNRLGFVHTKRLLEQEHVNAVVGGFGVVFNTLRRTVPGVFVAFSAPRVTPTGFEVNILWFSDKKVFPHDVQLARALAINALAKVHHRTDAIAGFEWAVGVAGDEGTATPSAADVGPVAGDSVELSPSGRATCRTCRATIDKGALRFVEASDMGQRFHHLACAVKKLPKRCLPALEAYEGEVPDRATLVASASEAKSAPTTYPYAEVAKTGRASCLGCQKPIAKDSLRVAIERQVETPQGTMPRPGYYHLPCAKSTVTGDAVLANTPALTEEQKAEVRRALA